MTWSAQDVRVDGTSLKTYAYGIVLDSPLESMPKRRGTNQEIAYLRGNRWRRKTWDPEVRILTLWVDSRLADGTFPATPTAGVAQRNANVRSLMKLFTRETSQVTLERDVLLPAGLQTWSALAEVTGGIIVAGDENMPDLASVSLELSFADPFWYGPSTTVAIPGGGGATTVTNPGEATAWDMTLTFIGSLTNPVLTNDTIGNSVSLSGLSIGTSVILDWRNASATQGSTNVIASVRQNGAREWMLLEPGNNSLRLTGGGGRVDLTFRPPRV